MLAFLLYRKEAVSGTSLYTLNETHFVIVRRVTRPTTREWQFDFLLGPGLAPLRKAKDLKNDLLELINTANTNSHPNRAFCIFQKSGPGSVVIPCPPPKEPIKMYRDTQQCCVQKCQTRREGGKLKGGKEEEEEEKYFKQTLTVTFCLLLTRWNKI